MTNKGRYKIDASERRLGHYEGQMAVLGNNEDIFVYSAVSCIHINCSVDSGQQTVFINSFIYVCQGVFILPGPDV